MYEHGPTSVTTILPVSDVHITPERQSFFSHVGSFGVLIVF